MSSNAPPIVLTFGLSDPTGGSGLQADLMTLASMGCHGVSVLTDYIVRDSTACDEVTGLDSDMVAAQARMLLEDMPVAAFKISAATRAEVVSAITEVVADYDDVPLVLALDFTLDDEHVLAAETTTCANRSPTCLAPPPNHAAGRDYVTLIALAQPDGAAPRGAESRCDRIAPVVAGAASISLSSEMGSHRLVNTLYGEEGQLREDIMWDRSPHRLMGITDTFGAAIAALLANGQRGIIRPRRSARRRSTCVRP